MKKSIIVKKQKPLEKQKMIVIYPWMMKLGITNAVDLYVYADLYNLNDYYGEVSYDDEFDIETLADYIGMSASDFDDSVQSLYRMNLIYPRKIYAAKPIDPDDYYQLLCMNDEVPGFEWRYGMCK